MTGSPRAVMRGGKHSLLAGTALVMAVVAAYVIYRPDRSLPFDILDFSEFLPILQSTESFWGRTGALIDYYAGHGRASVLTYALLSLKWELFGAWTPGWHWSRFLTMIGILVLSYRLLRRLGATAWGAAAGSSVFVVAPSATGGWIRLTMAEPPGLLMLLGLCLASLPDGRPKERTTRWFIAALLIIGILLLKEMLAVTLIVPVALLAIVDEGGGLRRPTLSPRLKGFLWLIAGASAACLGPMALVFRSSPSSGFASRFGAGFRSLSDTIATWLSTLIPFDPAHAFPGRLVGLVLGLTLLVLAAGWVHYLRSDPAATRQRATLLTLALFYPLLGAVAYIPWVAYQQFYAVPYLIGTAVMVGMAMTGLQWHAARLPVTAASILWFAILVTGAMEGNRRAALAGANQRANYRLVARVAALQSIDTVLVPSGDIVTQSWQGLGATLARYAAAIGKPWPVVREVSCASVGPSAPPRPGTAVVYFSTRCPRAADPSPIVERFHHLSLRRLQLVTDSVRIDIAAP
jgi:hypothetical protein